MGKNLNIHFYKEDIHKDMKKCSTSLVARFHRPWGKTIMGFHFTSVRMAIIKKWKI